MQLAEIVLHNYRSAKDCTISLDPKLNVLCGINGAGKTTILDACAISLSWAANRIKRAGATGRQFRDSDVKNGTTSLTIKTKLKYESKDYSWSIVKLKKGQPRNRVHSNFTELQEFSTRVQSFLLNEKEQANIPLFAYYPIHRNVLDIPLRIRKKHLFELFEAYDEALTSGVNFRTFFEWFRQREDLENESRIDNSSFKDSQLSAVRVAVEQIMPGYSGLRVRRSPLRMEISKGNNPLSINQLSDGEKGLLALIGDIARRLAIANPKASNPLNGQGIIMIDEIEMHLHPAWQKIIITKLPQIFSNCQFIISTHSPHVINQSTKNQLKILKLNQNGNLEVLGTHISYGQTVERILEDIMGLQTTRPQIVQQNFDLIYDLIDKKEYTRARNMIASLKTELVSDPELHKAETLIQRKKAIGK